MKYISRLIFIGCIICLPALASAQNSDGELTSVPGVVLEVHNAPCEAGICQVLIVDILAPEFYEHEEILIEPEDALGGRMEQYNKGDRLIVQTQEIGGQRVFFISDRQRSRPLMVLTLLFLFCVILFGGTSAIRSLIGMFVTAGILLCILLPGIIAGYSPLWLSIGCSIFIILITFLLTHGWTVKTVSALLGTAASLLLTGMIGWMFSIWMHMQGLADEEILFLLGNYPHLHTQGILLAGFIIGTLGILDDITVSQASAVFELHAANPQLTKNELYARALRIGKDHVAAAVNTLVLAYAGASLPLLLLLTSDESGEGWLLFINREIMAMEILRTLAGSIGILAAVPLTTAIAAILSYREQHFSS